MVMLEGQPGKSILGIMGEDLGWVVVQRCGSRVALNNEIACPRISRLRPPKLPNRLEGGRAGASACDTAGQLQGDFQEPNIREYRYHGVNLRLNSRRPRRSILSFRSSLSG
jgi:hypothetical protein